MKKKLLLLVLPLLTLGACKGNEISQEAALDEYMVNVYRGLPVIRAEGTTDPSHVTYLLLSPFGYVEEDGKKNSGGKVEEKFYEHCIPFVGDTDKELPVAKSTVSGATFRGWAYYDESNDHVWPDYYDKVPAKYGLALKAMFDGTNAGGNSGSGTAPGGDTGGGTSGGGSATQSAYGIKKADAEGTIVLGNHIGMNFEGYDEWLVSGVSFAAGESFEMYDSGSQVTWKIPNINPYSFGANGDTSKVSEYLDSTTYTMKKACTVDIYIQLQFGNDRVYFELK